jgi:hypothetical protein
VFEAGNLTLISQYLDKFDDLKTKKQFQLQFKRTMKEFGDWVKRYLELGFRDNVINIRQLQLEFQRKV